MTRALHSWANSCGVISYLVTPFSTFGSPAFGFRITGTLAYLRYSFTTFDSPLGPNEQFTPMASAPIPSRRATIALGLAPVRSALFSEYAFDTKTGRNLYCLYWEGNQKQEYEFKDGFVVAGKDSAKFLEEKLSIIGLNAKERNEFIMYWLPIIESNEHNLIYFELTEELQKQNELIITPQPDTLIRIRMHVMKVDKNTKIKEQYLSTQDRIGFTAIEWGGVIYG